jgi:hypothetical protein
MPNRFDYFTVAAQPAERLSFEQNMAGYFDDEGDLKVDAEGVYARDKAKAAFAGWTLGTATEEAAMPKDAVLMPEAPCAVVLRAMVEAGIPDSRAKAAYRDVRSARSRALERERFEVAAREAGISDEELPRWPEGLYQFNATQHAYVAWQISRVDRPVWLVQEPSKSVLRELLSDAGAAQRVYRALIEALAAAA